jgi:hypothetical protein
VQGHGLQEQGVSSFKGLRSFRGGLPAFCEERAEASLTASYKGQMVVGSDLVPYLLHGKNCLVAQGFHKLDMVPGDDLSRAVSVSIDHTEGILIDNDGTQYKGGR